MCLQYVRVGIVGGSDQAKICEQLGKNGEPPCHMHLPSLMPNHCFTHLQRGALCPIAALQQGAMSGKSNLCTHAVTRSLRPCSSCAAPLEYDYLFSENGLVAYKDGKVRAASHFSSVCTVYKG